MPRSRWHFKLPPGKAAFAPGEDILMEVESPVDKATGLFVRHLQLSQSYVAAVRRLCRMFLCVGASRDTYLKYLTFSLMSNLTASGTQV
jgi:hypothetical protein